MEAEKRTLETEAENKIDSLDERALIEALLECWHAQALQSNPGVSPLIYGLELLRQLGAYYKASAAKDALETTVQVTFTNDLLTHADLKIVDSTDPEIKQGLCMPKVKRFQKLASTKKLVLPRAVTEKFVPA